jgi:glycosyltransferase involved in cell wall biosynthesis
VGAPTLSPGHTANGVGPASAIRLLILGQLPPPYGGMEVMTEALVAGLRAEPRFVMTHINTQASRSLAEKGGKHQLRKSLRGALQTARLLDRIIRFRPRVIYLPLTSSSSFLGFLRDSLLIVPGMLCHKQIVVHLHNGVYAYTRTAGVKRRLVSAVLKRVSLAIVLGERLRSVFDGMVPPSRIACIPNGVDDRPFARARARLTATPRADPRKRILFMGLMHREKGFHDLIDTIPLVPDAEFVFAGEWPSSAEEQQVHRVVRERGVQDRTGFVGVITGEAKYDLFLSADIFVLPSYFEGQPVVVLEALAAGLPIVCTDCGALNSAVKNGWNGFFVPRSNPGALAARLNQLLGDDALRHSMGEHSRRLYEEEFTIERFVQRFADAVEECAAGAGASAPQ